jgi:DNA-binding response OmpR family regulator
MDPVTIGRATLSPQERAFFSLLVDKRGEPVPVADLLNATDSDGFNGVAKVVVCRLRRKLAHRDRRGSSTGGSYSLEGA